MGLRLRPLGVLVVLIGAASIVHAAPSVYPTGVTIYDPARTWSGYTVLSPLATQAVIVIDMNGNVVKRWDDFNNSAGGPARILPGGSVISAKGARPPFQESLALEQRDFSGKVLWSFNHVEEIELRDAGKVWSARQHHDWQREDFPSGYYSPGATSMSRSSSSVTSATAGNVWFVCVRINMLLPVVAGVAPGE